MRLHSKSFHYLPTHGVTGVLDTKEEVDAVLRCLSEAGFAAHKILVLHGKWGLEWLDADGTQHGLFSRVVRSIQKLSSEEEEKLLKHAQEALLEGHYVLIVMTDGSVRQRQSVRDVVRPHTTRTLFYCGTLAIEEL